MRKCISCRYFLKRWSKCNRLKEILTNWAKINKDKYESQRNRNAEEVINSPDFQLGLLQGFYEGLMNGYFNSAKLVKGG